MNARFRRSRTARFAPRRALVSSILAAALLVALPAAARELVIRNFDERVLISPDGAIDVTETIVAQFIGTNWHGIYRTIPVEYTNPEGLNYTLFLQPVSVTDDAGQPLKYQRSRQSRYVKFKIYVPDPDDSTRTVVLRYRVPNALRFFNDHDELYWNVTGDEWEVPIDSVTAEIQLPAGATGLHAIAYTGAFGSRQQDADVEVAGSRVTYRSTRPLGFHEGLTAVVGWDKGFVREPGAGQKLWFFVLSNWPFAFPIAACFVMFWLWWTRGRDPERDAVTVQYEPPAKLTPAECGTLVANEVAMRDITATLVDLAVKGYLTIEQTDPRSMLGIHHRDYTFHLKKPQTEWSALRPHENTMLNGLFFSPNPAVLTREALAGLQGVAATTVVGAIASRVLSAMTQAQAQANPTAISDFSGEGGVVAAAPEAAAGGEPAVALSALHNRFYTTLPIIRNGVFDGLMADGYYLHRPDRVRGAYMGGGIVSGIVMIFLGVFLATVTGMAPLTWVIAGLLTGALVAGFGWFMPARTIAGARALAQVLGFEEFLSRVEREHIERLETAPELFEKYLPYAMALGVEKKWVQAFSNIAIQPPSWYQGGYGAGFQPYLLVNDLNLMSTQAGSVMSSAPRSSGGSGFGGGGGSGGGFGGGGGGGF
ncbi:MAG TPA: DUF2207 domain-containing protein [Candidatus Acidoferrales bacterium]|nr:DUF2207 domain-containing protein [Candidatus Acidoferrales bacterium]